jgi:hypothetical protein
MELNLLIVTAMCGDLVRIRGGSGISLDIVGTGDAD